MPISGLMWLVPTSSFRRRWPASWKYWRRIPSIIGRRALNESGLSATVHSRRRGRERRDHFVPQTASATVGPDEVRWELDPQQRFDIAVGDRVLVCLGQRRLLQEFGHIVSNNVGEVLG